MVGKLMRLGAICSGLLIIGAAGCVTTDADRGDGAVDLAVHATDGGRDQQGDATVDASEADAPALADLSPLCPPEAPTFPPLINASQGTIRFVAKATEVETCSSEFCFEGNRVALFTIVSVIADCQRLPAYSKLKQGDSVPVPLESGLGAVSVGDTLELGCLVQSACADGCKPFPSQTSGPCFAAEFGCRTRCYEPIAYPPPP